MTDDHLSLAALRALNHGEDVIDVACPLCGPERSAARGNRKVLRIWDDGVFLTYKCARCEAHGWARDNASEHNAPRPPRPRAPPSDHAALARFLWARSAPLAGSVAETYLRARACYLPSPNLRYLPGRGDHPPAMIGKFKGAPGVHLTKLKADGSGKAGSDKDKIMLGPSAGFPIVVQDNPERGELFIAEGIEDALSLALVTGWSCWAAGAAGRMQRVLPHARAFEQVFIAVDDDAPGSKALVLARIVRSDVIAVPFGRTLGIGMDANKALIRYGAEAILAAIEYAEAQNLLRCKRITSEGMRRAIRRAEAVFLKIAGPA
jgi:hypothetical protein